MDGNCLGVKEKRVGWAYICFNSNGTLDFADFSAMHCCSVQDFQLIAICKALLVVKNKKMAVYI